MNSAQGNKTVVGLGFGPGIFNRQPMPAPVTPTPIVPLRTSGPGTATIIVDLPELAELPAPAPVEPREPTEPVRAHTARRHWKVLGGIAVAVGVAAGVVIASIRVDRAPPAATTAAVPSQPQPTAEAIPQKPKEEATPPASLPRAAAAAGSCTLEIDSNPKSAAVLVDGKPVGQTPARAEGLFCGRPVDVVVARQHFDAWQRRITPVEGEVVRLVAPLG